MSRNDVIIGVAALVLVVFSLVVSLVVPRRRPDFPGERMGVFGLVAVLLVAGVLTAVEVFGEGHHFETPAAARDEGPAQPPTGEDAEAPQDEGVDGAALFGEQGCGQCHTLAAAGATGTFAPNLDESQPSRERALEMIVNGGGGMPAFGDALSDEEVAALADYVVEASGG